MGQRSKCQKIFFKSLSRHKSVFLCFEWLYVSYLLVSNAKNVWIMSCGCWRIWPINTRQLKRFNTCLKRLCLKS